MAILTPTGITGRVSWLGVVRDRAASLRSVAVEAAAVRLEGFEGECHSGLTRPSCSRVTAQYPVKGTTIRNTRQVSVLSVEKLAETARRIPASARPTRRRRAGAAA